jgi:uncharacterized repeat protein (TIGR03803 family)
MANKTPSVRLSATAAIFAAILFTVSTLAAAQTESVIHSFADRNKGPYGPVGGLIFDGSGNLYGVTQNGGTNNSGTVFEFSPTTGGGWSQKTLHNFDYNGTDGVSPFGGLVMDTAGNLYGTTYVGGANDAGVVYELVKQAGGGWRERILHNFNKTGTDGQWPEAGLAIDAAGNLYGTTVAGGVRNRTCDVGCGTIFELSPSGGGWKEKILYAFPSDGNGGFGANCAPIFDSAGNLYGTAGNGGAYNYGTVWQLVPTTSGMWTENNLYNFDNTGIGGYTPTGTLVFDSAGNLYGPTTNGGTWGTGTIFKLSPAGGGVWNASWLYSFNGNTGDGTFPNGNLIFDASGNLYGTALHGGSSGWGMAFELTPATGAWTETVLTGFNVTNGASPQGGMLFDSAGNLYGITSAGGSFGGGTLYEITP